MVGTNNHNPREMAKEIYKDMLQQNAMLISNAIDTFIRCHADCVVYDEEFKWVEVAVLDPSKKDMEMADAVYALSNPSFDWLSTSQDIKDYLKKCFNEDLQETLRNFGMTFFDMETIRDGVRTRAERDDASNYDENGVYIGPFHSGIRMSYMIWSCRG